MKWISAVQKPFKAAIVLFMVMISVIIFSLLNRKYIRDINKSMTSIYHDRLIPASDIFHLTQSLYLKRSILENYLTMDDIATDPAIEMATLDGKINMLIARYEKTYLVKEEQQNLQKLKHELYAYQLQESILVKLRPESKETAIAQYRKTVLPLWQTSVNRLSELNDIQTSVGSNLLKTSDGIDATSELLSTLQLCIVIVMGTIVVALAFNYRAISQVQSNYKWN